MVEEIIKMLTDEIIIRRRRMQPDVPFHKKDKDKRDPSPEEQKVIVEALTEIRTQLEEMIALPH